MDELGRIESFDGNRPFWKTLEHKETFFNIPSTLSLSSTVVLVGFQLGLFEAKSSRSALYGGRTRQCELCELCVKRSMSSSESLLSLELEDSHCGRAEAKHSYLA
ncbi:hypothetical protein AcV5_002632 [Taiwanofungus camphoratus]|nr:hypothetical protein AcV5_002632 [Antrodia cinnamomea]